MPVIFNKERMTFHLQGKTYSYILKISEGELLNLYWGAIVPDGNFDTYLSAYYEGASFELLTGRLPYEVPTRGRGWYGTPAVNALNAQGNDLTVFTYTAHEIVAGKPALPGLPASYVQSDAEAQTLKITLTDTLTGLQAVLSYTVFEEYDVLARSMTLMNTSGDPVTLRAMQSASVPLFGREYSLMHLKGAWTRERAVIRTPLGQGMQTIESQCGASSHGENPFIALTTPETTEHSGTVYAMALVYSGSFRANAEVDGFDNTRLSIGLNPDVCQWQLESGASFTTPEALLVFSAEGLNGMSRRFHKIMQKRVCRGVWRDRERPILINNWEATYMDFNAERILSIAKQAQKIGVELFVLDDGWFGHRDDDTSSLGDWVVDKRKLPEGLGSLARDIEALGMKFGLWFEPEMISPDSNLYQAHPDWCLHVDGRARTQARQQLILDLSRQEVQDYIIDSVSAVLRSAPVSYVKWDMNRNMTEPFSGAQTPQRQMETQHRYMLGLYHVLETITSMFPDILFESCSGGGGRFDAGMLYYMPQTWTSDDTDPLERLNIQYGTSMVYPPSTMCAHVSASPNHQTGRVTGFDFRCKVALSGNYGFELDLNTLTPEEMAIARDSVTQVKALRKITQNGEFTRLLSPFHGNVAAWQFLSGDQKHIVLCVFQKMRRPNPIPCRVRLNGLCNEQVYCEQSSGIRYSGAALMNLGIVVPPVAHDYSAFVMQLDVI